MPLPVYTVTALRLGTITVDKSGMTYGVDPGVSMDIPVWGAAVEGDGVRMLVDTGFGEPADWNRYVPHRREDDETLPAALAGIGWRLSDIDAVINSHLHYDHAENNLLLPDAQFYVSAVEWEYAQDPIATQRWLYDFPWTDDAVTFQNYVLVANDHHQVRPGIRLIQTPGHSRGHQSVLVNTAQGVLCIAGDAACVMENFTVPTPPGGLTSAEQALDSLERMRELSDVVLMNHDPELSKFQSEAFPAMPEVPGEAGAGAPAKRPTGRLGVGARRPAPGLR
ncbi:MAG: N-acyl homoserine lactone hydrolase [Actinomycetota bacterium]|nr:N-acyl homoserine lactone hydrolase [Actinomycetota bacterium]